MYEPPGSEDPPGITNQSFPRSHAKIDGGAAFELIEVGKIRPCLRYPEWLNAKQRYDEESRAPEWQERPNLEPRYNVVEEV